MPNRNAIKYSPQEIEARNAFSRKVFKEIDENLTDFLNYVPIEKNHLEVYSTKLISLVLEVGPEILSTLELAMCQSAYDIRQFQPEVMNELEGLLNKEREIRTKKKSLTFTDYSTFLLNHAEINLNTATVLIKESDLFALPFEEPYPEWWNSYNLLRHDKYANVKRATFRNTLKATSGLFWLIDSNSRHLNIERLESQVFQLNDDRRSLIVTQKI
jgi:hypothetical protein